MDPISIVTLSGGVAKLCYQIATTLFNFACDVRDVDDSLNTFATEISSFSLILRAVTSTLNDPLLGFDKIWRSETSNQDVWSALGGSIENLKRYLDRLRSSLHVISKSEADKTLFNQAIKAFELRIKKDNVDNLRSVLRTHQLSLNTALVMVQLYAQAHLPHQKQPDLRQNITLLKSMAEELPPSSQMGTVDHQHVSDNIEHLKKVSQAVISNASEKAESSNGSECDTPFDPDKVQQWLQLSTISEIPPLERMLSNKLSRDPTHTTLLANHGPLQSEMSSQAGSDTSKKAIGHDFFTYHSSGTDRHLKSARPTTLIRRRLDRSISDSYVPTRTTSFSASVYKEKVGSNVDHQYETKASRQYTETSHKDDIISETPEIASVSKQGLSPAILQPPVALPYVSLAWEKPPLIKEASSDSPGSRTTVVNAPAITDKTVDTGYRTAQPLEYTSKALRYSRSSYLCSSSDMKMYDHDEGCCMRFHLMLLRFVRVGKRGPLRQ